jgi:hypothetical protein
VTFVLPNAPREFGWELAGRNVWVKQSAQFPMVDPFSGGGDETMMLHKVLVRYRPRWLLLFPLAGTIITLIANRNEESLLILLSAIMGLFLGWLVSLVIALKFPVCTLRVFFEKRNLRKRAIISYTAQVLLMLNLFGGILLPRNAPPVIHHVREIMPYLWLAALLLTAIHNRKLRCIRRNGDRFEIRGFSRKAIAALDRETKTGDPQAAR